MKQEYPTIDVNRYSQNTPERVVADYLGFWANCNWRAMFNNTQLTWSFDKDVSRLKQLNKDFVLVGAEILKTKNAIPLNSEVAKDIEIVIYYKMPLWSKKGSIKIHKKSVCARVICETAPYEANKDGSWGVNPVSVLRKT